jgi:hypothetical protein
MSEQKRGDVGWDGCSTLTTTVPTPQMLLFQGFSVDDVHKQKNERKNKTRERERERERESVCVCVMGERIFK